MNKDHLLSEFINHIRWIQGRNLAMSIFIISVSSVLTLCLGSSIVVNAATYANVQFDKHITIKDIAAAHDTGLPFDKYIATISSNAKSPTATEGQLAAWDFIKNSVSSYPDICKLASLTPSYFNAMITQGRTCIFWSPSNKDQYSSESRRIDTI